MKAKMGTSYFVSLAAANRYYRPYGFTRDSVARKISEGEIHIGEPPESVGKIVGTTDEGTRYVVEIE